MINCPFNAISFPVFQISLLRGQNLLVFSIITTNTG